MKAVVVMLVLAGPAQAHAQSAPCPFSGQTPRLVAKLYFGQSIKGVGLVSRRAWERFVAEQVTPALPSGFTVYDTSGQYRTAGNAIGREPTEVVEVAAEDTPEFRARVAGIADQYRKRFSQSVVGIVSTTACAAF